MGTIGSTIECEITKQFGSHYMCILLQHSLVQLRILKIHTLIPKMLLFFAVNRTLLLVVYLRKFYISTIRLNICLIKIRSKHSSNTLLSLLQFFMRQMLISNNFWLSWSIKIYGLPKLCTTITTVLITQLYFPNQATTSIF